MTAAMEPQRPARVTVYRHAPSQPQYAEKLVALLPGPPSMNIFAGSG